MDENIEIYFKNNFFILSHNLLSLHEIESMLPWEREIYLALLVDKIKQENEAKQKERNAYSAQSKRLSRKGH
jgi:hypothetical protein